MTLKEEFEECLMDVHARPDDVIDSQIVLYHENGKFFLEIGCDMSKKHMEIWKQALKEIDFELKGIHVENTDHRKVERFVVELKEKASINKKALDTGH